MATITLTPVADNTLYESPTGDLSNGAGDTLFAGVTAQTDDSLNLRRALLKFNVSAIPPGSQIDSVTLQLRVIRAAAGSGNQAATLHRVLADWGEGTSDATGGTGPLEGDGAPATNNDATWLYRFYNAANPTASPRWTTPGGDFAATASATALVGGANTSPQWTGMIADVQAWVNNAASNFGWLLKLVDETTPRTAKGFGSRQHATAANRPQLTIEYTAAANQPPTLDPISDRTVLEDALTQTVNLTGISAGPGETQTLTVTATSSDPSIVPHPTVTYTSPSATGTLRFTPAANQFGTVTITVTVMDNGGTADGGIDTFSRSFAVTVTPVNDPPTLNAIPNPPPILEDAGRQTVDLLGISAGPNESQTLTITAVSSNLALIPNPSVTYTSPETFGSLAYTPVANQSGAATITVTVIDNGGTANGGVDRTTRTFTVSVTPVNDPPTLAPIADPVPILEDSAQQTVNLTGISAGPGDPPQTLTITATSNNPGLIPSPTVVYTSPSSTGSLRYTPVANQSGIAVITVTVTDNGGTANGGVDTTIRTFTVSVTPVNDPPTLDAIAAPPPILEDAGPQTVNLTGISAGPDESQTLLITASSSNSALIPNPAVSYTNGQPSGSLTFAPAPDQFGIATITVTVMDDGGTANGGVDRVTRTFTVSVAPVNDPPTLDAISAPLAILEDSGPQTLSLTGISSGPNESQPLTITATSSNPSLIPDPSVAYTSPASTGSLSFSPAANASGVATITVVVRDNGGTASGGADTFSRSFSVTVLPVNDPPSFEKGPDQFVSNQAGPQSVAGWAKAVSPGPPDEASQTLTFLVTTNNDALFATLPAIDATGRLTYAPKAGSLGSAVVTVVLMDSGGTENGGADASPPQTFTITVSAPGKWHNARMPLDVDGDNAVSPIDLLLIFNYLNQFGPGPVPPAAPPGPFFYDTSNDDFVSPIDALLIVNYLNGRRESEGETAENGAIGSLEPDLAALPACRRQFARLVDRLAQDIAQAQSRRQPAWPPVPTSIPRF